MALSLPSLPRSSHLPPNHPASSSSSCLPPPRPRLLRLQSTFLDQSHLQFYGNFVCSHSDNRSNGPAKLQPLLAVAHHRLVTPSGISGISEFVTDATGNRQVLLPIADATKNRQELQPIADPTKNRQELQIVKQDLMKELADLKAQLKQKKKQLKAQKKDQKKTLKSLKPKKTKAKKASSSSSSESSDSDCESINMRLLRQNQAEPTAAVPIIASVSQDVDTRPSSCEDRNTHNLDAAHALRVPTEQNELSMPTPIAKLCNDGPKIEVCVGGKCKRAGSEQLLASLRGQIPGDSSVAAVPCKCMGKCGMAINVRVQKEETNPQHHSHVGVGDAGLLLRHHFGLGHPPTGLPSLGFEATVMPCMSPQRAAAAAAKI